MWWMTSTHRLKGWPRTHCPLTTAIQKDVDGYSTPTFLSAKLSSSKHDAGEPNPCYSSHRMLQPASSRSSMSSTSTSSSSLKKPAMPTLEKLAIVTPTTSPLSSSRPVRRLPVRAMWHQPYPYPPYAYPAHHPYPPPAAHHRVSAPPYPYPYPHPHSYLHPYHYYPPPTSSSPPPPVSAAHQGVYTPEMAGTFMTEYKGRRYPRYGAIGGRGLYALPCDEEEAETQRRHKHWMLRTLLGAPYYGPLLSVLNESSGGAGKRVLDVGTGSGVWAIDIAEMFPEAQVVGVDMAPMQSSKVPDNCSFELADVNEGLPYPDASYDVVHARMFIGGLNSLPDFLEEVSRVLRPGGIFLLFEPKPDPPAQAADVVPVEAHGLKAWHDALRRSRGPALGVRAIADAFKGCSLGELEGGVVRVPIGGWNDQPHLRHVGTLNYQGIKAELRAQEYLLEEKGGYSSSEIMVLSESYLRDLEKHQLYSSYLAFHVRKSAS